MIITVDESGLLGVTQQLSRIGSEFVHRIPPQTVLNPFASPERLADTCQSNLSPAGSIAASPGSPVSDLSPAMEGAASSKWLFQVREEHRIGLYIKVAPWYRGFARGAIGRRIDPLWGGPIELFLVTASAS